MTDNQHYQAIKEYYGTQCAKRSGVPLLNHIDEGLFILETIGATIEAKEAFCLHPLLQADSDLTSSLQENSISGLYLILNAFFTYFSIEAGFRFFGFGFTLASFTVLAVGAYVLKRRLSDLLFQTYKSLPVYANQNL